MKNLELMIDLEFMGAPPTAAITAIGAVLIDADTLTIVDRFETLVSLKSSVVAGMTMDADTVLWWLAQSDSARAQFVNNEEQPKLGEALTEFCDWLGMNTQWSWVKLSKVWGYGATADNEIMRYAFSRFPGIEQPWTFREDRCFRTFMDGHDQMWVDYGTAHKAGDDAMAQALTLIEVYRAQPGRVIEQIPNPPPMPPMPPMPDPLFDQFDDDCPF